MAFSWLKFFWLIFALCASGYVSYHAYTQPAQFVPFTDLLATIISILIGVSLAISAVLSTRPAISPQKFKNEGELNRIQSILKRSDDSLQDGQHALFWLYYITLILAVILKFIGVQSSDSSNMMLSVFSALFAFVSCLSLLWSATLPSLLRKINSQRLGLE